MSVPVTTPQPKARLPWFPWKGKRPFYGWVIVFSGALTQFTQGVSSQSFSSYLSFLQQEFGWSKAILAIPRSITQIDNSILGPIEGFLVDKLGPRIMVMIGTSVMGLGLILFSMTHSLWMYFASSIIIDIGTGFQGTLVLSVAINHWFQRKRTIAQSVMLIGYALAGVVGVPLVVMVQTANGWRTAAFATGVLIWVIGIPISMLLFRRPEPFGLLPDGDIPNTTSQPGKISQHNSLEYDFTLREALRTPAFWLLAFSGAMGFFGMGAVQTHLFLHLKEGVKLAPVASALIWSIASISNIPSRLVSGFLGDRKPKRLVLGVATIIMGLSVFVLGMADAMPMAVFFAILYGIGWGARTPVMNAIQGDYFGRKSQGLIRGWLAIVSLPFAIAAPVLCGYLADINGNYRISFMVMSLVSVAGGCLALLAVPPKHPQVDYSKSPHIS